MTTILESLKSQRGAIAEKQAMDYARIVHRLAGNEQWPPAENFDAARLLESRGIADADLRADIDRVRRFQRGEKARAERDRIVKTREVTAKKVEAIVARIRDLDAQLLALDIADAPARFALTKADDEIRDGGRAREERPELFA